MNQKANARGSGAEERNAPSASDNRGAPGLPALAGGIRMEGNLTLAVRELTDAANFLRAANSEADGVESIILIRLIGETERLRREAEELRAAKEAGR
jgi:hypothetical protein